MDWGEKRCFEGSWQKTRLQLNWISIKLFRQVSDSKSEIGFTQRPHDNVILFRRKKWRDKFIKVFFELVDNKLNNYFYWPREM